MTRFFILLAVTVAVGLSAVPVAAQAQNGTATPAPETGIEEATIHVDSDVRISDWQFTDGAFRITFEADEISFVTLTESTQQIEGASSIAIQEERLLPGTNDVVIPIERTSDEAAVVITTAESIDNGEGTVLSTGVSDDSVPFENTSPTAGWLGGASTVAFMFILIAWRTRRKEPKHPRRAE